VAIIKDDVVLFSGEGADELSTFIMRQVLRKLNNLPTYGFMSRIGVDKIPRLRLFARHSKGVYCGGARKA
jgi:hypothetical protein